MIHCQLLLQVSYNTNYKSLLTYNIYLEIITITLLTTDGITITRKSQTVSSNIILYCYTYVCPPSSFSYNYSYCDYLLTIPSYSTVVIPSINTIIVPGS